MNLFTLELKQTCFNITLPTHTHTHTLLCHRTIVQMNLTRLLSQSHFPHLESVEQSRFTPKVKLNLSLAAEPSYFLTQNEHANRRLHKMKGMNCVWSQEHVICVISLFGKLSSGIVTVINVGFWSLLIRAHRDNMDRTQNVERMTDMRAHESRLLLSCCQYLMETEQDVLCGLKRQNLQS